MAVIKEYWFWLEEILSLPAVVFQGHRVIELLPLGVGDHRADGVAGDVHHHS